MSKFQLKVTHHTKQEPGRSQMNEKRQPIDANTKMTKVLEVADKDFKAAMMKMFQQAITNMLETNEQIKPQQRNRRYQKEPNGSFRTKK